MENLHYREIVYDKYVSSGQAKRLPSELDPEKNFKKHRPFVTHIVNKYFPADRNVKIIDIACGTGVYIYYAKKNGYNNIIGVDVSREQVELANSLGIPEVVHVDLFEFLENCNEKFECVLLMDIIEHLSKDELLNLLSKLKFVLTPNAKIILHIPNAEGIFGMRVRYGDITHEICFTPFSISQILSLNGYHVVKCIEDRPLVHSPFALLRRICWDILSLFPRLLLFSETAQWNTILSQNMTVIAANKI